MPQDSYESRLVTALKNAKKAGDTAAAGAIENELRSRFGTAPGAPVIDRKTGAPVSERLAMSFKVTPQGRRSYLEETYGAGNVGTDTQGNLTFVNPQTGRETAVNPYGFDLGDIAGIAGDIAEGAVGLLSRTPSPLAVGGLLGAGDLARQGISSMLPGDDQMTLGQRASRAGSVAALGAGSQYGANALMSGLNRVRPSNLTAEYAQRQLRTPTAGRANALERTFPGLSLSQGQRTGSRAMLTMEGFARRNPASADIVQGIDLKNLRTVETKLNNLLNVIDRRGLGSEQVGKAVESTFNKALDGRLAVRRAKAKADFGAVEELSKGASRVPVSNTRQTIQEIIESLDVPGGGDATASLVGRLKRVQQEVGDAVNPLTMQRLLQVYGNAAKGKGQLFKDIDAAQQRMIGARVERALLKDIDDAVAGTGQGEGVSLTTGGGADTGAAAVEALKTARRNYAINSKGIDELEQTVIGRMLDAKNVPAPEVIADKFFKMPPSQLRSVAKVLDSADPSTMNAVRRNMLETIIEDSKAYLGNVPQSGRVTRLDSGALSPRRARTAFEKYSEQLQAAGYKPAEIGQMKRAYEALVRLGDDAGTGGSPTQPLQAAEKIGEVMLESAVQPNAVSAAQRTLQFAGRVLAPRKIAERLMTPAGRQELIRISQISDKTKRRAAAIAYMASLGPVAETASNLTDPRAAQTAP